MLGVRQDTYLDSPGDCVTMVVTITLENKQRFTLQICWQYTIFFWGSKLHTLTHLHTNDKLISLVRYLAASTLCRRLSNSY